jgi:asparagine synthase (glutamine-hydrolysing)
MCGIAGLISLSDRPLGRDTEHRLSRMSSAMQHRGPDDNGTWIAQNRLAAFAHARLSIIDPTPEAHQPMVSAQGNAIVFNGEIYNYKELRTKYRLNVPPSDTAVLLALLDLHGERILPELRGFFAFAYWNADANTLLMARDAIGKKPIYYGLQNKTLCLASEARTLIEGGFSASISQQAVSQYFAYYAIPHPLSIFEGILTLPQGSLLRVDANGKISTGKWHQLPSDTIPILYDDAVKETRRLLAESVRYRLVSDVPVGAFLSGGLDSNAVVALMSRDVMHPVETFSIGFKSNKTESEADLARIAARHYGTNHHEAIIDDKQVAELLPKFFASMDSPTGDGLNTFLVAHAAKQANPNLKVVLSGVGGDELFLGYRKYRWLAQNDRWLKLLWRLPAGFRRALASGLPKDTESRTATAIRAMLDPTNIRTLFDDGEIRALLQSPVGRGGPTPRVALAKLLRHDLEYYLHDTLLRDLDQMTMAHSLEARAPMLDIKLVEFALRLPMQLKAQGSSKQLLADAVKDLLPPELLSKPKTGFELPMKEWLTSGALRPYLDELQSNELLVVKSELLNQSAIKRIRTDFLNGRSHYLKPWSVIVLEQWLRADKSPL